MGNKEGKDNNSEKFVEMVGLDPRKNTTLADSVFSEVVAEFQEERNEAAKETARSLMREAFKLMEDFEKVRKDFRGKEAAMEKSLGKVMKRIRQLTGGGGQPQGEDTSDDTES